MNRCEIQHKILKGFKDDSDNNPNMEIHLYLGTENISAVASCAFMHKNELYTITLPDGCAFLGDAAFLNAQNLYSCHLGEGLLHIGQDCFFGTSLERIVLPETLKYIGENAFFDSYLEEIYIPKNVSFIGKNAFGNCPYLKKIVVDPENEFYHVVENQIVRR